MRTVRPWPYWRTVRYGYFGGLFVALCGGPVIFTDGFVMIPMLMVYIAAIGPLNSFARKVPTCAQCGAIAVPRLSAFAGLSARRVDG